MWIGIHALLALCLLVAVAPLAAEGFSVGRRLRLRSGAGSEGRSAQNPWMLAAQLAANPRRPPVVHFLFLATAKINNMGVWNAFFAQAPKDQYRAFVHCKLPECLASVQGSPMAPVTTVPSFYCADLVTPMNHLLSEALRFGGPGQNAADKFVFVSDSTLPAKPFSEIYNTLVKRSGSDFCVTSVKEWATIRAIGGKPVEMAIKHHQWSILERSHAEKVSQAWKSSTPLLHEFLMKYQMNLPPHSRTVKTFAGTNDGGCLDEFYHMAAIYGTLPYEESKNETLVNLPAFTNSPLHVAPAADLQGSCDTFVAWPAYAKERDEPANATGSNPFTRLYTNLDPLSVPYSGNGKSPGHWGAISSHGIRAIRTSEFLFARKFVDSPKIVDGGNFVLMYPQLVFM